MVKLADIKKDVIKYYHEVAKNEWITNDYHCVYVTFYDNGIASWDYTFYDLEGYLEEENEECYDSVEVKFDPITIKIPNVYIK